MPDQQSFLLLDPPSASDFCRRASLREKDSAHDAHFPSIDLILLSGAIRDAGFRPHYIDAQLDRLTWSQLLDRIRKEGVQGIISLLSSSQLEEELAHLKELKASLGGIPVYGVGTIVLLKDKPRLARILQDHQWLDGMILNTAENNLGELITPGSDSVAPFNIAKYEATQLMVPEAKVRYGDGLRISRPEHDIFRDGRYCFPQSKRGPVTCVQWAFGCPFRCEFCIDNQLYKKMLYRDVNDVIEELVEIDRLGFREVYFKDLTFGLHRGLAEEFLAKLANRKLGLKWLCTTRVDVATRDMLELMKEAGCYGIEFGVEHAHESKRRMLDKKITDEKIAEVFADCRRLRIETTAFIMLAFEDDTEQDVRDTIRFARSLRPNYVSFNVVNALPGTPYEERARKEGFLREESDLAFAAGNIRHTHLNPAQVEKLRRQAMRSFYFSPRVVFQRLLDVRSFFELRKLVRLGLATMG
ncbi:MAG: radical SAM protein [Planctomycetes bacterium]|nr:radical SAM protein [Planctomycetota bacterium]MBI3833943.1 radical SAM protein [Planctomycetota bacterium]